MREKDQRYIYIGQIEKNYEVDREFAQDESQETKRMKRENIYIMGKRIY